MRQSIFIVKGCKRFVQTVRGTKEEALVESAAIKYVQFIYSRGVYEYT